MRSLFKIAVLIGAFGLTWGSAAYATPASPIGEWLVADQSTRIAIRPCGSNMCGKITWTSDGQDIGRAILIDMAQNGSRWTGTVIDVRDNTKYLAHIALQSERALKLDGCVLGGAICSGETWTRFK